MKAIYIIQKVFVQLEKSFWLQIKDIWQKLIKWVFNNSKLHSGIFKVRTSFHSFGSNVLFPNVLIQVWFTNFSWVSLVNNNCCNRWRACWRCLINHRWTRTFFLLLLPFVITFCWFYFTLLSSRNMQILML